MNDNGCTYKLKYFYRLIGDGARAFKALDVCADEADTAGPAERFTSAFVARSKAMGETDPSDADELTTKAAQEATQRAISDVMRWLYPGVRPFATSSTRARAKGLRGAL